MFLILFLFPLTAAEMATAAVPPPSLDEDILVSPSFTSYSEVGYDAQDIALRQSLSHSMVMDEDSTSHASHIETENVMSKLLSVKLAIAILCLLSIAVSVSVTTVLGTVVCDDALDDTRESASNATGECFIEASNSLNKKAEDLLAYSSTAVSLIVKSYFQGFYPEMTGLVTLLSETHRNANKTDWNGWWWPLRHELIRTVVAKEPYGLSSYGFQSPNQLLFVIKNDGYPLSMTHNNGSIEMHDYSTLGLISKQGEYVFVFAPYPLVPRNSTTWRIIADGLFPLNTPIWTGIQNTSTFVAISLTYYYVDPGSGIPMEVRVTASTPKISRFLREISADTLNETGANIYLFLTIGSTWVADRYRALNTEEGNRLANVYDQTGYLTGVSHGDETVRMQSPVDPTQGFTQLLKDHEATDPVISGIARNISNQYSEGIQPRSYSNITDPTDIQTYVTHIKRIRLDGIDWWLVTGISSEFVFGDVQREQVLTKARLDREQEDVEDRTTKSRMQLIFIIVALGIVLVMIAFISVHFIWNSTMSLNLMMQKVAEMQLEEVSFSSDKISVFNEVRHMQKAFQKMVKTLKEYRAYVPTAVLLGAAPTVHVEPPGGNIALVFTDIVSSTKLWALSASAMNTALELHNEVMRKALTENHGYEVKTIGDAFMVAFTSATDAMKFCFRVQKLLLRQTWPRELELHPVYSDVQCKQLIWSGLQVRMGCHYGEVISEENPLTGRIDYRGSTVNMSSRLEGKALPGTVCISDSLQKIVMSELQKLGNPVVRPHGEHTLKGLGNGHQLHLTVPKALGDRCGTEGGGGGAPAQSYEMMVTSITPSGSIGRIPTDPSQIYQCDSGTPRRHSIPQLPKAVENRRPSIGTDKSNGSDLASYKGQTPHLAVPKKTGLSLVSSQVTVAVCKLIDSDPKKIFEHCNLLIRVAVESASYTDGVVVNVTGSQLIIAWNASKSCKMHVASALRFCCQLERRTETITRIGVATGDMLHGNVGTHKQRFNTTFGRPLQVAEAAAEQAFDFDTFCIFADCTHDGKLPQNTSLSPFLRTIDIWLDVELQRQFNLYEVLTSKLTAQLEDAWASTRGYVFFFYYINRDNKS